MASSASTGSEYKLPWTYWQSSVLSHSACSRVSTPSATTSTPRSDASRMMVRTMATVSSVELGSQMNDRSILRASNGMR